MTKIHAQTSGTLAAVTDKSKMEIPVADMHAPDGSGNGLARSYAWDVLYQSLVYQICTYTGHGVTDVAEGRPVAGCILVDDANGDHYPSGILMEVIDVDTLRIAPVGSEVTIDVALLEDGNAYDTATQGRYVYWDFSEVMYVEDLPVDSHADMPCVLEVIEVGASTFTARVRCY